MENLHPAQWPIERLEQECRWEFGRGSGPGGQHRNKVETLARVEHVPSGIRAAAGEERSQGKNRVVAMQRLRCELAVQMREVRSRGGRWSEYCRGGKIRVSQSNEEYPGLLAEAIGVIVEFGGDLTAAAQELGTSATQLVKFLASYPPALEWLNAERQKAGLAPRIPR
jgi:hypothetical protein